MKTTRRTLLKNAAALGVFAGAGFPHIWIKNADLAAAATGEIKVGVLFSLTGTTAIIEEAGRRRQIRQRIRLLHHREPQGLAACRGEAEQSLLVSDLV